MLVGDENVTPDVPPVPSAEQQEVQEEINALETAVEVEETDQLLTQIEELHARINRLESGELVNGRTGESHQPDSDSDSTSQETAETHTPNEKAPSPTHWYFRKWRT